MKMQTTDEVPDEVEFVPLQSRASGCHGNELQMLLVVVDVIRRQ